MAAPKRSLAMMPVDSKIRVWRLTPSANSPTKLSHAGMTYCAAVFQSMRKLPCLLHRYSNSRMRVLASSLMPQPRLALEDGDQGAMLLRGVLYAMHPLAQMTDLVLQNRIDRADERHEHPGDNGDSD